MPRQGQNIAFRDVNIEENVKNLHVLLDKGRTFYLEKGAGTFWVLEMGGGGGGFHRPCPQQPWSCPKLPLHDPGLLLNISFSAAPPCQQGRPNNCAEDQGLFFLKQREYASGIHLYLESAKSVAFPTPLIV